MRIAVIAPPWLPVPPTGYGGTELVLDVLCRGLQAAGHEILLYTTGDSTCPVPRDWTHEHHLGTTNTAPAAELAHVIDAYDAAGRWGADIIHDHTITGPVWAQLHAPGPVVTTNHGPFAEPLASVYQAVAHQIPVVAISHHQASTAGNTPIAAVIHHGIDLDQILPGPGDGGYVAFVGRMSADKGVHRAVRAAQHADLPLKIAAKMREPAEQEYFETLIRPHLGNEIEYLGELGADEKHDLLRHASCLLNPIDWPEPFGMVMIEALAAGTPVVGTRRGAAPEIIQHGRSGFLATGDELPALLRQVDQLDRRACRDRAENAFSMERMASSHAAFYTTLRNGPTHIAAGMGRTPPATLDMRTTRPAPGHGQPTVTPSDPPSRIQAVPSSN